jgi:8-oxo-dGTP diphosphatase
MPPISPGTPGASGSRGAPGAPTPKPATQAKRRGHASPSSNAQPTGAADTGADQPVDLARYERPSVTVDIVILTVRQPRLEVLLVQRGKPPYKGMWAIPGGFVGPDETLEAAARRELEEETGVRGIAVQQFQSFGDPGRDPRGWVISVAHLALAPEERLREQQVRGADDAAEAGWFAAYEPPELAFDHARILTCALDHLRQMLDYIPVAWPLLPEAFTLPQLQVVYEVLLHRRLDSSPFHKRMLAAGLLEQAPASGQMSGRGGQAFYRFRERLPG